MEKGLVLKFGTSTAKRLALLMGICYLINPLQRPLNFILHEAVTIFESPNGVLGHEVASAAKGSIERHEQGHRTMEIRQAHNFVDLVSSLFEASEENEPPGDPYPETLKIDKHLTTLVVSVENNISLIRSYDHNGHENKVRNGHLQKLKKPPRGT